MVYNLKKNCFKGGKIQRCRESRDEAKKCFGGVQKELLPKKGRVKLFKGTVKR